MGRKWNNIKEKKGAQDKARTQIFTKLLRDVTKTVKTGGESPESNFMLRVILERCRKSNVPKDIIERAIKKGMGGEDDGYFDVNYEGYGPHGVAIFVEASTNNPTRTAPNVKNCFNKCGGSLGTSGCLQFVFEHKAVFEIPADQIKDEDAFSLDIIDAGADDIQLEDGYYIATGPMPSFGPIQKKLDELKIKAEESGLERVPLNFKEVDKETFDMVMKLIGLLEDDDDVNKVYHNIKYDESLFT
ncbi:MAG: transcriptional regulator [Bdellovibrionales bacterium GWA2_49_15]|nr:MAG: transcriptional regulator [Bdellovibrionales bacterium GWA2_49_15]HAZ12473.1 YebC/PmpR family DNA-binding transcriptional regulator [Bdellovibrionales bacterium]